MLPFLRLFSFQSKKHINICRGSLISIVSHTIRFRSLGHHLVSHPKQRPEAKRFNKDYQNRNARRKQQLMLALFPSKRNRGCLSQPLLQQLLPRTRSWYFFLLLLLLQLQRNLLRSHSQHCLIGKLLHMMIGYDWVVRDHEFLSQ